MMDKRYFCFVFTAFYLLTIVILQISCNDNKCPEFDYRSFGLDTNVVKKNKYFINNNDTIIFHVDSWEVYSDMKRKFSFRTIDECCNGLFVSFNCQRLKFSYYSYYIVSENGYQAGINSYFFNLSYFDIKKISEIKSYVEIGEGSYIYSITVKNGEVVLFVDQIGKTWRLVKTKTTQNF